MPLRFQHTAQLLGRPPLPSEIRCLGHVVVIEIVALTQIVWRREHHRSDTGRRKGGQHGEAVTVDHSLSDGVRSLVRRHRGQGHGPGVVEVGHRWKSCSNIGGDCGRLTRPQDQASSLSGRKRARGYLLMVVFVLCYNKYLLDPTFIAACRSIEQHVSPALLLQLLQVRWRPMPATTFATPPCSSRRGRHGCTPIAVRPVHTKSVRLLRQFEQRNRSRVSGTSPVPASIIFCRSAWA